MSILIMAAEAATKVVEVAPPPVLDPQSTIVATMHIWWNNAVRMMPSVAAGIVFLLVAWLIAGLVGRGVRRVAGRRDREDLGVILGSIVFGAIMVVAFMVSAVIIFPSVNPADVLATLGVGSVAVGFAFKDILQNLFAGVLLLINRPFRRGDQIQVTDFEGTVEHIQSRATLIRTYDGRRVIIPNADIYTSAVTVNTAFPVRRDSLDVGIDYDDDPARAADLLRGAVAAVDGVVDDPPVQVLPIGLGESDVQLQVKWWTRSPRQEVNAVRARVVLAVVDTLRANDIDLPYPSQIVMLQPAAGDDDDGGDAAGSDAPPPPTPDAPAQRRRTRSPTPK